MSETLEIFEANFKDFFVRKKGQNIVHLCYNDLFRKHLDWDLLVKSFQGDILYNIIKEHQSNQIFVKGQAGDFIITTKPSMDRMVYEFEIDSKEFVWKSTFFGGYELLMNGTRIAKWKTREDFSSSHWGSIKVKEPGLALMMPILISGYIISFKLLRKHCF
jgi:hypothetical protein